MDLVDGSFAIDANNGYKHSRLVHELKLSELSTVFPQLRLPEGRYLWHEGDPADECYMITEGFMQVFQYASYDKLQIIGLLGPKHLLGLKSMLTQTKRNTAARAFKDTTLVRFDRLSFKKLIRHNPEIQDFVCQELCDHLDILQSRLKFTYYKGVRARIISELLHLASEYGERTSQGFLISLGLTKCDLEKITSAGHTSINRFTKELESKGLVSFSRKGIIIHDLAKLAYELGDDPEVDVLINGLKRDKQSSQDHY